MQTAEPTSFLDVPVLLESSMPRPRLPWFWIGLLASIVLLGIGTASGSKDNLALQAISWLLVTGLFVALPLLLHFTVRKMLADQRAIEGAGELVQLRHYPQAAMLLQQILLRPARTHQLRAQALVYLSAVLARYHRFEDAIAVQTHLTEHHLVDAPTAYGLRLGRAMAMLREDHLVDADRAIGELRRIGRSDVAGGALVEIYRDVKTGHPEDALRIFNEKLPLLRDQLGHRVGDAYALAARAYDLLGRHEEAACAFAQATLLIPWVELCRRYADVEKLVSRYAPSPAPKEVA